LRISRELLPSSETEQRLFETGPVLFQKDQAQNGSPGGLLSRVAKQRDRTIVPVANVAAGQQSHDAIRGMVDDFSELFGFAS